MMFGSPDEVADYVDELKEKLFIIPELVMERMHIAFYIMNNRYDLKANSMGFYRKTIAKTIVVKRIEAHELQE